MRLVQQILQYNLRVIRHLTWGESNTIRPKSKSDTISAADVNFGQDIVNGTSQTPTPSTPNTGSEVDTPSTTTPTPSTPSYDDNRSSKCSFDVDAKQPSSWDDIVDIDINGSDPKLRSLSWNWNGVVQMDFHI